MWLCGQSNRFNRKGKFSHICPGGEGGTGGGQFHRTTAVPSTSLGGFRQESEKKELGEIQPKSWNLNI